MLATLTRTVEMMENQRVGTTRNLAQLVRYNPRSRQFLLSKRQFIDRPADLANVPRQRLSENNTSILGQW